MPHLHLSLQSGDDLILKRMKRRHSRQDAIEFCAQVRRLRPDITLGADIIAGFPTETEEMFARSEDLVDGMRSHLPARVSLFEATGHAGRADAAGGGRARSRRARSDCGRRVRRRCRSGWRRRSARRVRSDRERDAGAHRAFPAGGDIRRNAGRGDDARDQGPRWRAVDGVSLQSPLVVARLDRAIQYAGLSRLITDVSGDTLIRIIRLRG